MQEAKDVVADVIWNNRHISNLTLNLSRTQRLLNMDLLTPNAKDKRLLKAYLKQFLKLEHDMPDSLYDRIENAVKNRMEVSFKYK